MTAVTSPVPAGVWADVVASDPGTTVYQTRAWSEAVRRVTGTRDVSRLYHLDDGRRLVLPLLERVAAPGVVLHASYPTRYGSGGLLATGGLRGSDVRHVLHDLLASSAASTRLKANHDVAEAWADGLVDGAVNTPRRVEVLDLDGGFERVWDKRFESSARGRVRKAERAGLVVERATSTRLVDPFYELYVTWTVQRAQQSGVPPRLAMWLARRREPRAKFRAVSEALGDACRFWIAWQDDRPAAGIITLVYGRYAVYWQGYSDKGLAGPLAANNLLHRLAIEDACDAGCRWYSMGESGGVSSLLRFKRTLGATPRAGVDVRVERLPLSAVEEFDSRAERAVRETIISGVGYARRMRARASGIRHE